MSGVLEFLLQIKASNVLGKGEKEMSTKNVVMDKIPTPMNEAGKTKIRTMVQTAMLAGIAILLMLFEIPLWFAPSFYEIDLSEVPVLIGAFSMGPAAGVVIELLKILLNFIVNGTVTAGLGEISIGCAYILPAAILYNRRKTRNTAVFGMVTGTILMTITGCVLNAYVLLPAYATAFQMPIEGLISMGSAVNPGITSLTTFVLLAVAPFNLLKGFLVSIVTFLLYKKIKILFKTN